MTDFKTMGEKAMQARYALQKVTTQEKNDALCAAADALFQAKSELLAANEEDLKAGREKGMKQALLDRLALNDLRIRMMAEGLREVAALDDPVGEVIERIERPNGLYIRKVRVPLGVVGIIYESRPNVTADAFGLCFKTGNATILKGGSDAIRSNQAITRVVRDALQTSGMSPDCVQLIEDTNRETTLAFMKQKEFVDVLIPRGSGALIQSVVENATIPVIETGTGNCHVYVDGKADTAMALDIIVNAKTQRVGVCNAAESLVVHKEIAERLLPEFLQRMKNLRVEVRADEASRAIMNDPYVKEATEEDFATEYLDYIISVKTVSDLGEAIAHINRYNTKHSEAIITTDADAALRFLNEVDAACVYVNASTRFTDGYEFGFGAEIGISTQKLHARGPMGLRELTSYKYYIEGSGQIRS